MAIVPINNDLNKSEEVADFLLFMLNEDRAVLPKLSISQILINNDFISTTDPVIFDIFCQMPLENGGMSNVARVVTSKAWLKWGIVERETLGW